MYLWLKKDFVEGVGEMMVSFDPPEPGEEEEWVMLSTRERHYRNIADELDKQALLYRAEEDYRSERVAKDLAKTLRLEFEKNSTIN